MHTGRNFYTALSLVLGLMMVNSLAAQTIPTKGPIPFKQYDLDGDGSISQSEFNRVQAKRKALKSNKGQRNNRMPDFTFFDVNKDNKINPQELATGQTLQRENRGKMNMPNQGRKGKGNMGMRMPQFSDIDVNDDNFISENELNQFRAKRISKRANQGYSLKNAVNAKSFATIDLNQDNKISLAEFSQHQLEHKSSKRK